MHKVLLVIMAIVLSGCGTNYGFSYVKPEVENNAVVYIYRPEAPNPGKQPLGWKYPEVFIDGKSLGVLKLEKYIVVELKPGMHEILFTGLTDKAKWEERDLKRKFSVHHTEQKYLKFQVRYDPNTMGLLEKTKYQLFLTPLKHDDAIYEINKLNPQ
ncbi:DUF2846 domain-containing protein [Neptuniibacter sp. QD29_5]|uniref:DUF2846 domain-containing protein n=1 Tax=Neptuniibacter sp. QD29_5 TaxID=3398207 RepID=UPI0039F46096